MTGSTTDQRSTTHPCPRPAPALLRAADGRRADWLRPAWPLGCLVSLALAAPIAAADLRPSWQCLPEETVAMFRMPQPKASFESLRTRTKAGAVIFKQERIDKLIELLRQHGAGEFDSFQKRLNEYNLKLEDWQALFGGELGLGVVVVPGKGAKESPLGAVLGWFEPGEEMATRLLGAMEKAIDDGKAERYPPQRTDLDLAGHKVMHIAVPVTELDDDSAYEDIPENFGKLSTEERAKWFERQRERLKNAKRSQRAQQNIFVARIGSRLLLATAFADRAPIAEDDKQVDFAAASRVEEATGVFARFLAAHEDASAGAMPRLLEAPGLSAALPEGQVLYELLVNPAALWKLAKDEKPVAVLKRLGLDGIGPVAGRVTLDGNLTRTGYVVSAPAPRQGVLALIEQAALPAEVPAWVSSDVVSYEHISFDLGKAYGLIKQLALAEGGDRAQQSFSTLENQLQLFLQTDPATLLGSLGSRHTVLNLLPKVTGPKGQAAPAELGDGPQQRISLVWQLKDEALWKRLLQQLGPLAGGKIVEEQGFSGIRAAGPISAGAFVGRGYLVVGMGTDVIEGTLNTLRNPPTGAGALRSGRAHQRAIELLPPEPGLVYQFNDGARYGEVFRDFVNLFQHMPLANIPPNEQELFESLKKLIPQGDELEGLLGVSVGDLRVTEHGLVGRSVAELPAP